ncbi:MAG TPA: hypothetical protein VGD65_07970 [Chryseosolibacter sp.]
MDINGVWTGEYIVHHFMFETGKETPVPFVMKITTVGEGKYISLERGLFEGVCQDDPVISKVALHAKITGSFDRNGIYIIKQFPMLIVQNPSGGVTTYDDLHPEIVFAGEFKDDQFAGTWYTNRTFRKINGHLRELMAMKGTWRMRKP